MRRLEAAHHHEKLEDLHPADIAEIMEDLSAAERQGIIASLDEETAAAVLAELDERLTTQIVEKLDPEKAADILEKWLRTRSRPFPDRVFSTIWVVSRSSNSARTAAAVSSSSEAIIPCRSAADKSSHDFGNVRGVQVLQFSW